MSVQKGWAAQSASDPIDPTGDRGVEILSAQTPTCTSGHCASGQLSLTRTCVQMGSVAAHGYPPPALGGPDQFWRSGPFAVGHTVSKARLAVFSESMSGR